MLLPTLISKINFLSEAVRCGASKKGLPEDSTSSTASGSQLFKHVPQIAAYHKKLQAELSTNLLWNRILVNDNVHSLVANKCL